jgi:excisionase family DNA binding protein
MLSNSKEAADRLRISVKTLLGHVRDGSLRYVNVGRGTKRVRYAFTEADLAEFEQARARRNGGATCQSTSRANHRSTSSTFNGEVIAFTELQRRRHDAKPKRSSA